MLSLCKKFGNALPGLNYFVFCNADFAWVRNADKIVQMPKIWFREFPQIIWFKKTKWTETPQPVKLLVFSRFLGLRVA